MIEIHQAIFGQGRDQGHSLLRSSYSNDSIAAQFSGYTDLVDRPQNGVLSSPIVRGFIIKSHFLLVKSFPDLTGRTGRVFSHAIIIKVEDYLKLKDISDLRQFHLNEIDKEFVPQIIYYDNNPDILTVEPTERMIYATSKLVNHLENNNTIAWVDETEYWPWVSLIWRQIPDQVKKNIKLGYAFNSKYLNDTNLNLIIISEEIKSNWIKGGYAIIDNHKFVVANSDRALQDYILGVDEAGDNLEILLKELNPNITEIDDLKLFNKYAEVYCNIENNQSFSDLLMLTHLISKYNANPKSSISEKNKLIDVLADVVSTATPEEFFSLKHQTWIGYEQKYIDVKIGNAMQAWLTENLFTSENQIAKAKIVIAALSTSKENLWHNKIIDFLTERIKLWNSLYKNIIWEWLIADKSPIEQILLLLPDTAQDDMIESIPVLGKSISEIIMSIAQKKGWMALLGIMAIKTLSSQEAFEKILSVTSNLEQFILEKMADMILPEKFLIDACEINDDRLLPIAIERLKIKPSLKLKLDIANLEWQKIWAKSAQGGLRVWEGIKTPKNHLYTIMDRIVDGDPYDKNLLIEIGKSECNSLIDYGKRAIVWSSLPVDCKNYFLVGTLTECLVEVSAGKIVLTQLEQPLLDCLESPEIMNFIINTNDISIETKINIIEWVKILTEDQAKMLVDTNEFTREASSRFGDLVQLKKWKQIAKYIFFLRDRRPDLEPALQSCYQQLGFFERLGLAFSGYNAKIISQKEFWDALYEKAIVLYPEGPNQHGLWERSGGDRADLYVHGSGKHIWQQAIKHIKNGGYPTQKRLLEKMIEDYPYEDLLKQLKHII